MLKTIKKLFELLDPKHLRQAAAVMCLVLLMAIVEAVGVASILPFLAVLSKPELIDTNPYLSQAYRMAGSTSHSDFLFLLGIAAFMLLVGSTVLRAVGTWAQLRFTNRQSHALGLRLLSCYLRQPYHWYLNRHSSDLTVAIIYEVNNVVQNVLLPSMVLIANTVSVTLILGLLLQVDPWLAMSAAATLGLVYAVVFLLGRRYLSATGQERVVANHQRNRALTEAFGGIKYVKLAGLEPRFAERFGVPSGHMARLTAVGAVVAELPSLAMQGVVFGGMLAVLLYLLHVHGDLQSALPVIGLFAVAGYRLMPALQALYKSISQIRFAAPSLELLVRDLLELEREQAARRLPGANDRRVTAVVLDKALALDAVSYRYPGADRPSLDRVTVRIDARTTIGVVGSTGAGKTTFVDIVLGLLAPDSGRLLADGISVDDRTVQGWQQGVGYVPQTIFLLDDTIAANIAFGSYAHEIDMAAVERAARIAHLHDFVVNELPNGYWTVIGEQGVRLSGGQRQRVGIARALYRDPQLVVFDEATSALDSVTEQIVMEAIHELEHEKTMVIVAHRLSTVRSCDRIFVLERGAVVASGTYEQLIEGSEHFRTMVASAEH
jgi:ABC-type multidrug transport system fused ATPase/permease subunit